MGTAVKRVKLPRPHWHLLEEAPEQVQKRIRSMVEANGMYLSHSTTLTDWGRVADLFPAITANTNRGYYWEKENEWVNFAAPFIPDTAYDKLFIDALGDKKLIRTGVIDALIEAHPHHDPKLVAQIADALYLGAEDGEYTLFHLFALNEFMLDEHGSTATFGEYLKDVKRFNAIHANMLSLTVRQGQHTTELFTLASTGDRKVRFPLWYQGINGTKAPLMRFTTENYATLLADKKFNWNVSQYDVGSVIGQAVKLIKSPNEGPSKVTVMDMEVTAAELIHAATARINPTNTNSPLEALAFAAAELKTLISRTNAEGVQGKRNYGTNAAELRKVLTFVTEHTAEFSFDDVIGIIGVLCVPSSFTSNMTVEASHKLILSVVEEHTADRAVNFLRLASRILLTRDGERPDSGGWAEHLKDGSLLDVDGDLSVGMIVAVDGRNSTNRAKTYSNWRKLFH